MALQTFFAGSFTSYGELAEWDGTNHDEIVAWLRDLDTLTTDPAFAWRVTAITDQSVTFHQPGDPSRLHPFSQDRDVVVGLGEWVWATDSIYVDALAVQRMDPTGKWKTADPYGRPSNVDDLTGGAGG